MSIRGSGRRVCLAWTLAVSGAASLGGLPAEALDPLKALTQYPIESWGYREGLPQGEIQSILQSRDGYLWLGTNGGAVRFDGVRFEVFDRSNSHLTDNEILSVREARDGSLWFATAGGISRLEGGVFRAAGREAGLPAGIFRSIYEDRDGSLWFGADNGLLVHAAGERVEAYGAEQGIAGQISAILRDKRGRLWVASDDSGLYLLEDKRFIRTGKQEQGLLTPHVRAILEDRQGRLWVGGTTGLMEVDADGVVVRTSRNGLPGDGIACLHEGRQGALWIGTSGGGLLRLQDSVLSRLTVKDGLPGNNVTAVYEDREGSVWIATDAGLSRLRDGEFTSYLAKDGLADDYVYSILQDRRGVLWIGSPSGLASYVDGAFRRHTTADGLVNNFAKALFEDKDGVLWIGTNGGVSRYQDGRFTTVDTSAYTARNGRPWDLVRAIGQDGDGALWFASQSSGVTRLKDGRFTRYTMREGLCDDAVRSILRASDGSLWFGTRGHGICHLKDGVFKSYGAAQGLAHDSAPALYLDAQGTLWVGTRVGLSRFRDGRFTNISARDGLAVDVVSQINEDSRGNLWLGGSRGVVRVSRHELDEFAAGSRRSVNSRSYGRADGLSSTNCSIASSPLTWRTRDGNLWFATVHGLVMVDPERSVRNTLPPPVKIEHVVADGQRREASSELRFGPGTRGIEFHYTGLSMVEPARVQFKYRLEGLDPDWIDAGTRRVAYFTNVPPGHYTFRVTASNNDGVWNGKPAAMSLQLQPYFHQTGTFYALCLLLAGAGVAAIHHLRVRQLEARERNLKRRVDEAVAQVQTLTGLLPICAWCKRIRDDGGYWNQIESYIASHSAVDFTHGICPECREKLGPGHAPKVPPTPGA